jgi:hypothetical protein
VIAVVYLDFQINACGRCNSRLKKKNPRGFCKSTPPIHGLDCGVQRGDYCGVDGN